MEATFVPPVAPELKRRASQRVQCGGDGPPQNGDQVANPGSEPVHELPHEEEADGVGHLEGRGDVAVVLGRDVQVVPDDGEQHGEHDAVQVVVSRDQKEQR